MWRTQMLGLIESQELHSFIDGELSPSPRMVPGSDATQQIQNWWLIHNLKRGDFQIIY
jgi:hypothetical protein